MTFKEYVKQLKGKITCLEIGNFKVVKSDRGYQVFQKIQDTEHPFYNDLDCRLSHLVFNYRDINEIQEDIPELRNCNELFLVG